MCVCVWAKGGFLNFVVLNFSGKSSRHDRKWRKRGDGIRANMAQYGLSATYLDVCAADAALNADLWRRQPLFDAIVTDRKSRRVKI